jgi:uncharacterized protein YbjT (DUF2867 family)
VFVFEKISVKMVTVAFAGAATGFGRTMLLSFIHLNQGKHKLVLLSRSKQPGLTAQGVDVRPVDYNNHEQLVEAVRDVDTVLSVIGGGADAIKNAQLKLVAACEEAGVKRFAPSEYAGRTNEGLDLYAGKDDVIERLKQTKLEWTRFQCGLFMGVLATGTPKQMTEVGTREDRKTGEEEALAGLRPWNFVINMKAGTADYPGDGSAPLIVTDIRDVARFVFCALDLESWPKILGMRGDVKSFKEAVAICEKVQGRKWLTRNNAPEELKAQMEEPGKEFYSMLSPDLLTKNTY